MGSHIYGQDMFADAWHLGMIHLRAEAPVARKSLMNWLQEQLPNASENEINEAGEVFIRQALERKVITEEDGWLDLYPQMETGKKATPNPCMWYANCPNVATTSRPHPILGDVPCCERCAERDKRIEAAASRPSDSKY